MPVKTAAAAAATGVTTTFAAYSLAGAGVFAPFALMHPGTQDRLEAQTNKWAPRWEKGLGRVTPRIERGVKRLEPPVARAVRRMEETLPLENAAKGVERRIRKSIDGMERKNKRVEVSIRMVE